MTTNHQIDIKDAPRDTFGIVKILDKDKGNPIFVIERIWFFQAVSFNNLHGDACTMVTAINGDFSDGYIQECSQTVFVGTKNECEIEKSKLEIDSSETKQEQLLNLNPHIKNLV